MKSILKIDDDDNDYYIFERTIKKVYPNAVITRCVNGCEALEYFMSRSDVDLPHVAFLDVNMPVLGGFGFLEQYNDYLKQKNIPPEQIEPFIVMLTSSDLESDRKRALNFPFVKEYLVKPASGATLLQIIS